MTKIDKTHLGKVATPVKRSRNLILDKCTRRTQKQNMKKTKHGRLQHVKEMMGEGACPTFVVLINISSFKIPRPLYPSITQLQLSKF